MHLFDADDIAKTRRRRQPPRRSGASVIRICAAAHGRDRREREGACDVSGVGALAIGVIGIALGECGCDGRKIESAEACGEDGIIVGRRSGGGRGAKGVGGGVRETGRGVGRRHSGGGGGHRGGRARDGWDGNEVVAWDAGGSKGGGREGGGRRRGGWARERTAYRQGETGHGDGGGVEGGGGAGRTWREMDEGVGVLLFLFC